LKNQFNDRRFAQATGQAQVFSYHEGIAIREASATRAVVSNDLLFGKHLLLRKGKKELRRVMAK
jgi:hypothetical protein